MNFQLQNFQPHKKSLIKSRCLSRDQSLKIYYRICRHSWDILACQQLLQPRPQGLLAFQYGGGRREDPGTQRTKTIADWCILLRVHTCALIGLFIPKQRWLSFEGFVEAEKCFLQCLRPKRWIEFRSDCSENCDCTVGRQRFEDSDIACLPRARPFSLSPATSKRLLRRL